MNTGIVPDPSPAAAGGAPPFASISGQAAESSHR
eukprot:CAMPEP_0182580572 /NCGR_PEP_ID=MMETSP1324-20130603/47493_1 /TAXON_ID=236786 /ORGANISM="Florenciella sp., Strain RCC1587" /LENGTH=33 /DNA_ID= /DNA_START= /DNA_END= /DNA_ORIENTATION=